MRWLSTILLVFLPWLILAAPPPTSPTRTKCPPGGLIIRSAGTPGHQRLSFEEASYVQQRTSRILPTVIEDYFLNAERAAFQNLSSSFPLSDLIPKKSIPKIGIAVSGGGYRAAIFGAAVLNSLDARNDTAVELGTGGVLQASTYLAGLSGGAWLVTSLAQANFPTLQDLIFAPNANSNGVDQFGGWLTNVDLTSLGDKDITRSYAETLIKEILPKFEAGFPLTISDLWGKTLGRHFVNGTNSANILLPGTHDAGILFSNLPQLPTLKSHHQPFPIVIGDSLSPKPDTKKVIPTDKVPLNSEIWEFNLFEVGSWDPSLASFIPTSLLGSTPGNNCVVGFDEAAFIAGVSSNLFSEFNRSGLLVPPVSTLIKQIKSFVGPEPGFRLDTSVIPNPFKGVRPGSFSNAHQDYVNLVDGGLDGENLPLQPLLVRAREVDTIIAIDASSDTSDNFADGRNLVNAAKRAALFGNTYPFPPVPSSSNIFVKEGLNKHPTFFGCDRHPEGAPLIIYIANGAPPVGQTAMTNTSTFKNRYSDTEAQQFLDQAFEIATQGRPGTHWGTCLACAMADRTRARSGEPRTPECNVCMKKYCWNGH